MFKKQRLDDIEKYVKINQYVSLNDLVRNFNVSESTMRRDLKVIEQEGHVIVTRGGAVAANQSTQYELPYLEKRKTNYSEKDRIARAACELIQQGDTLYIDAGTTAIQMTEHLSTEKNIHVSTNDLIIAISLALNPAISLTLIGGSIRKGYYTAYGYLAVESLNRYHFDKVFLCLDAISLKYGCMVTNAEDVDIKQSIVKAGEKIIVICDHTKFEGPAFISICSLGEIDQIITGTELDQDIYCQFVEQGIDITLV
jgi:DeoR family fructose operon transcriptional repressor